MKTKLMLSILFLFILIYAHAQKIQDKRLIISYYPNGKIKEKGVQGHYENKEISTGIYIGTWRNYDTNGKLIETIYYHNAIPAKAYIEKIKYYTNGKIRSVARFNNYELYESTVDSIGIWKYYDRNGKLIKRVTH